MQFNLFYKEYFFIDSIKIKTSHILLKSFQMKYDLFDIYRNKFEYDLTFNFRKSWITQDQFYFYIYKDKVLQLVIRIGWEERAKLKNKLILERILIDNKLLDSIFLEIDSMRKRINNEI